MQVIIAFLFGLAISPFIFFKYIVPIIPEDKFLPAKVTSAISPAREVVENDNAAESLAEGEISGYATVESFETEISDTPPQTTLSKTPYPTKKPSATPTKKPTATPTKKPTSTPTPTIITPTPTNSSTPTPYNITPTPTAITTKTSYSSQEINSYIDRFAGQYSVDPNVLRHVAVCESGFNSSALSANGLYAGLYQFSVGAWDTYRSKLGEDDNPDLRFNAEEAVQTAAYVISIGKGSIWPNCMP